jgi:hypothetical protein
MTFGEKISELHPTIEAKVEFRGRERAGADVGLVYITGHSGRFVVDPHSTQPASEVAPKRPDGEP